MKIYLDALAESPAAIAYGEAIQALAAPTELRFAEPAGPSSAELGDIDIVIAGKPVDAILPLAPKLQWVAFWNAGIDHSLTPALEAKLPGMLITNASGMHGPQMAEHAMALVLAFTRGLPTFAGYQAKRTWRKEPSVGGSVEELAGQTLGIVGMGHIGEALAARARAFDVRVIGVRRTHTPAELDALFTESDHVVVLVPLTPATKHLVNARLLRLMKKTARLYNLARGPVVDEAALIAALQSDAIAGAGLDVFEQEPLSADSPLWAMSNVIITPHAGGATPHYFRRAAALFVDNLARLRRGEPLQQLHDPTRGY